MSRQRKISTEELDKIITNYIYNNQYISKLKYTELVEHARQLGYENLIPNDFGRNKDIKEKIKKFNEIHKSQINNQETDKYYYSEIDVEQIINLGKSSVSNQRILLQLYRENHHKANEEIKKLSEKIKELEIENQKRLEEKEEITRQYKSLKEEHNKQFTILKTEKKILKEERFIKYLNFLHEKNIIPEIKKQDIELMMQRLFKVKEDENDEIINLDINKEKQNITPIDKNINKEKITIPKMPDLF